MLDTFDKLTEKIFGSLAKKDEQELKPIENASDQSASEIELASYIKRKVEEARMSGSRIAHEGIWMTNIAYLLGFDSVFYDTTTRQYKAVGQPNKYLRRNRLHVNKILPTIQNRLSRLCKNPPQFDNRPESNNADDKDAARLGLDVISMIWDKEKINEKRITLMMWLQQCGYSFMKVCWDDMMGKPMVDPMTGESAGFEGDIRVEPVSAFEVFPDPLAKTMDECQHVVHAKVRKLNYFRDKFPERGQLVKEEGAWLLSLQYEMRVNALNNQGPNSSSVQTQMQDAAIELVYYERRSMKHPDGRMVTTANGIILEDKELPVGDIPLVKFDDVIIGGKFASEAIITHMRPVQDQYNRLITKRAEWTNRLLAGKFLARKGHGMHVDALNDQSGEVIQHNLPPGESPTIMPIPVIPQYAYVEEDKLNGMLLDISGINEVSRGQLPSASIPAAGMAILQEQDQSRIGVMSEQHEQAWAKVAQLILKYGQEYYVTDRVLKLTNSSMEFTVKTFKGADLRNNHDVICIRGSTVPTSKELKRQEIMNAYQQGILGDPQDPKLKQKVLGMLEYGDVAEIWNEMALDQNQIKEHLKLLESGEPPPRIDLDNHALHIQEKNKYRKTDKFKAMNPVQQQMLLDDIEWHVQTIIDLTNPMLKVQQQMAEHAVQAAANQPTQPPPDPSDLIDPHAHPIMQGPPPGAQAPQQMQGAHP